MTWRRLTPDDLPEFILAIEDSRWEFPVEMVRFSPGYLRISPDFTQHPFLVGLSGATVVRILEWLCSENRRRSGYGPRDAWDSIRKTLSPGVFARDGYRCVNCVTGRPLTVDHIVPLSRGGGNAMTNLQTLCRSCNSRKGARIA